MKIRVSIIVASLLGAFILFQNFAVVSGPILEIEIKAIPVTTCGENFQKFVIEPNDQIKITNRSVKAESFYISLPDQAVAKAGRSSKGVSTRVAFKQSRDFPFNPTVPVLPVLPNRSETPEHLKPGLCDFVKNYLKVYRSTAFSISTAAIEVDNRFGNAALRTKSNNIQTQAPAFQSSRVLKARTTEQNTNERLLQRVDYVIITQDLYRVEANRLAEFRNSNGIKTQVISVSELPGYFAGATTPAECEAPYERECYHYWGDAIDGVSQLAVPSLHGFHRETNFAQQYTRVSYLPGLIRAYLRSMKKNHSIKAALLIGDPEQVPGFYTLKSQFSSEDQNAWCSWTNWVSERGGYCNGGSEFTLPSDLFYSLPSRINLASTGRVNRAEVSPALITCKGPSGKKELKFWCDQNESRYQDNQGPMNSYAWAPFYPWTRIYSDPVTLNSNNSNYSAIPISEYIAVGRIVTQSRFRQNGKDLAVQNYVNKLIQWESHLPLFANNSISTVGKNDFWYFNESSSSFFANYGMSSKLIMSPEYLSEMSSVSPSCNSSNCLFQSNDQTLNEFSQYNHVAWYNHSHGSHTGIEGAHDDANPNSSHAFGVSNTFYFPNDHLTANGPNRLSYIDNLMGHGNKLVGHFVASSCDVSSYQNYSSTIDLIRKFYPQAEPASFVETLIGINAGGAINSYANFFVGWSPDDDFYDELVMENIRQASELGEPIGTALVNLQFRILVNYPAIYSHQIVNRVFMGDPYASIAMPE